MRACFLGQNVCALGFGVAMVQSPSVEQAYAPGDQPWEVQTGLPPAQGENPSQNRMVRELQRRIMPNS
jgi:hypothetical protein